MKTYKKLVFFVSLIVAVTIVVLPVLMHQIQGEKYFDDVFGDSLSLLPVQSGGRIMPMSSASADVLKSVSGKISYKLYGKKISSTHWFWLLNANPEKMSALPLLRTDNRQLQKLLNADGRYVCYDSVVEKYDTIYASAASKDGGAYAEACVELLNSALAYGATSNVLCVKYPHEKKFSDFLKNWDISVQTATKELQKSRINKSQPDNEKLLVASEYLKYLRELSAYEIENNNILVKPIPLQNSFTTAPQVLLDRASSTFSIGILNAYAKIADAINSSNEDVLESEIKSVFKMLRTDENINLFRIRIENLLNAIDPFFASMILFVIAFLMFSISSFKRIFEVPASVFLSVGSILYILAIIARVYIQMRPPVTNFYSSVVFTGAIASVFGLVVFLKRRSLLTAVSASFVGMLSLLVAVNLPYSGDTMGMMRAVLNSNFWLSAHVMTIMIGYCGLFLAGFIASFRLIANAFSRINFGIETANTADGVYILLCACLLFTFMGTMLGGIWADMSWGRFWG